MLHSRITILPRQGPSADRFYPHDMAAIALEEKSSHSVTRKIQHVAQWHQVFGTAPAMPRQSRMASIAERASISTLAPPRGRAIGAGEVQPSLKRRFAPMLRSKTDMPGRGVMNVHCSCYQHASSFAWSSNTPIGEADTIQHSPDAGFS